jgi:hypothetical protein
MSKIIFLWINRVLFIVHVWMQTLLKKILF